MLGTVQLIVHLPMMAVAFPSNASLTFSLIIDLANLKIIPVDKLIEKVTGLTSKTNGFGYSDNILQSMGFLLIGLLFVVFMIGIGFILFKMFKTVPLVNKSLTFVADILLFNFFIRSFIAGYLVFSLSAFLNLRNLDFSSPITIISSVVSILQSCICISAPFVMTLFLWKNFKELNSPKFSKRLGSIY